MHAKDTPVLILWMLMKWYVSHIHIIQKHLLYKKFYSISSHYHANPVNLRADLSMQLEYLLCFLGCIVTNQNAGISHLQMTYTSLFLFKFMDFDCRTHRSGELPWRKYSHTVMSTPYKSCQNHFDLYLLMTNQLCAHLRHPYVWLKLPKIQVIMQLLMSS